MHQLPAIGLVKRRAEREHLIQGEAEAVEIAARIRLTPKSFRGHVGQGSDDVAAVCRRRTVLLASESQIGDPHDAPCVQQQVRWLHVSMQKPLGVHVAQSVGDLQAHPRDAAIVMLRRCRCVRRARIAGQTDGRRGITCCFRMFRHVSGVGLVRSADEYECVRRPGPPHAAQFQHHGIQAEPLDELHGVIVRSVVFPDVKHGDNIAMVQSSGDSCLPMKTLSVDWVARKVRRKHLESDVSAERLLDRFVDQSHAAAPHLAHDAIIAQSLQLWSIDHGPGRTTRRRTKFLEHGQHGNTSRISSARSGYWSAYSDIGGRSPRRIRSMNDSASWAITTFLVSPAGSMMIPQGHASAGRRVTRRGDA